MLKIKLLFPGLYSHSSIFLTLKTIHLKTKYPQYHLIKAHQNKSINLNVFGGEVYEEGVKRFWYTASVFDPFQQWKYNFPVVDTAADVLLLVVVRVHSISLGYLTCIKERKSACHTSLMQSDNINMVRQLQILPGNKQTHRQRTSTCGQLDLSILSHLTVIELMTERSRWKGMCICAGSGKVLRYASAILLSVLNVSVCTTATHN